MFRLFSSTSLNKLQCNSDYISKLKPLFEVEDRKISKYTTSQLIKLNFYPVINLLQFLVFLLTVLFEHSLNNRLFYIHRYMCLLLLLSIKILLFMKVYIPTCFPSYLFNCGCEKIGFIFPSLTVFKLLLNFCKT